MPSSKTASASVCISRLMFRPRVFSSLHFAPAEPLWNLLRIADERRYGLRARSDTSTRTAWRETWGERLRCLAFIPTDGVLRLLHQLPDGGFHRRPKGDGQP